MKELIEACHRLKELQDCETRRGSTPASRSSSFKMSRKIMKSRTWSDMRTHGSSPEKTLQGRRLRRFSISGKGVVNMGDAVVYQSRDTLARESFQVAVIGSAGVGKTSLIYQFMTSEFLDDSPKVKRAEESRVGVLLDGVEADVDFLDSSGVNTLNSGLSPNKVDAFIVLYSISDRHSFHQAESLLQGLWKNDKTVILVGNKSDLVRSRVVPASDGISCATAFSCKFIEVSVSVNHNIDELLVGVITQIRLKAEARKAAKKEVTRKRSFCRIKNKNQTNEGSQKNSDEKQRQKPYRGSSTSTSLKVKGLLSKVWAREEKAKSCENLHIL